METMIFVDCAGGEVEDADHLCRSLNSISDTIVVMRRTGLVMNIVTEIMRDMVSNTVGIIMDDFRVQWSRTWRWFHCFRTLPRPRQIKPPTVVSDQLRRIQERHPIQQRRRHKRRRFVQSLRAAT